MFTRRVLNPSIVLVDIHAPFIAKKAMAGQFIIFRIDEKGERVPLTIAGYDREMGSITIIFQIVGKTTEHLASLNEGDVLLDVAGPLEPLPMLMKTQKKYALSEEESAALLHTLRLRNYMTEV